MCSSAAHATGCFVFRSVSVTGTTSSANAPPSHAAFARRLAPRGEAVHRFAPDAVPLGEALRGLGHGEAAVRVAQRLPQRVLERRRRPEPQSPARAPHHVRRLAHGFGAAGEHDVGLAEQDLVRALDDGLEPGAAEPVHGEGRGLDREARPGGRCAGRGRARRPRSGGRCRR